jgi:hemerythrin-like domain-containing protein
VRQSALAALRFGAHHYRKEILMSHDADRRQWISMLGAATATLALGATEVRAADRGKDEKAGKEVEAAEDLMREHGVLRRALLVYSEAASRIVVVGNGVPLAVLGDTAALFRSFGEEYHERALEEKHVFPPLIAKGGPLATVAKTLTAQHQRGREITDYISAVAKKGRVGAAEAAPFASTLAAFVRMYEHHAAIEDTIIFPAWKAAISEAQYDELSEQFEDLEHRMFGKDGFEDALERIAKIEQSFGLSDLAALTAQPPPKTS